LHTDIKGLAFALNLGINESQGDYIARMDADDISSKERIEKQVSFLNDNPEYDVVGCRVVLVDEHNNVLRKTFPFVEKHEDISRTIFFRNVMCHPALVFRKVSILAVGCYKFGFMSEDHELFIRMIIKGMKFYNINDTLFSYRKHSAQITDISNAWRHFYEISSFLYMHAFVDKKFKCFAGIIVIFPPLRKLHNFVRSRFFNKGGQ
ncbi:glycosyltransferase, partial [Citrobacter portucalensis]|uniref:glycosyltransferase n=1 Tax=Citrobacter portucalensis TaxID=1639133 RepID=UPI00226B6C60